MWKEKQHSFICNNCFTVEALLTSFLRSLFSFCRCHLRDTWGVLAWHSRNVVLPSTPYWTLSRVFLLAIKQYGFDVWENRWKRWMVKKDQNNQSEGKSSFYILISLCVCVCVVSGLNTQLSWYSLLELKPLHWRIGLPYFTSCLRLRLEGSDQQYKIKSFRQHTWRTLRGEVGMKLF